MMNRRCFGTPFASKTRRPVYPREPLYQKIDFRLAFAEQRAEGASGPSEAMAPRLCMTSSETAESDSRLLS